jgi:hypothetical protein
MSHHPAMTMWKLRGIDLADPFVMTMLKLHGLHLADCIVMLLLLEASLASA